MNQAALIIFYMCLAGLALKVLYMWRVGWNLEQWWMLSDWVIECVCLCNLWIISTVFSDGWSVCVFACFIFSVFVVCCLFDFISDFLFGSLLWVVFDVCFAVLFTLQILLWYVIFLVCFWMVNFSSVYTVSVLTLLRPGWLIRLTFYLYSYDSFVNDKDTREFVVFFSLTVCVTDSWDFDERLHSFWLTRWIS